MWCNFYVHKYEKAVKFIADLQCTMVITVWVGKGKMIQTGEKDVNADAHSGQSSI